MEGAMNKRAALGSWIRRFLMEYLVGERNLARNTQQSYRDAVRLLVVFTAAKAHKKADELLIPDIDADLLRAFLRHIEEKRKCSISSRNQRLAAIHALAGFIAERCPEYLEWCAQLRAIKSKRSAPAPVCYLEKPEIDALLDAPSPATKLGSRDRALLLFLYNSGAPRKKLQNYASMTSACTAAQTARYLRCVFTARAARFVSVRCGPQRP
jgi:site-specific recombinase XerD